MIFLTKVKKNFAYSKNYFSLDCEITSDDQCKKTHLIIIKTTKQIKYLNIMHITKIYVFVLKFPANLYKKGKFYVSHHKY